MADPLIVKLRDDLLWLLDHVVACLDGLDEAEANWRPPARGANSLVVIATHTLGAAEAHVLQLLAGLTIDRVRAREFTAEGPVLPVRDRLGVVGARITAVLDELDPAELDRERATPGGPSSGRDVMLWAVSHAAQHYGAAQLTRDLVIARRSGHTS